MLSEPGCNACHHNAVHSKVSPHPTMSVLDHQRLTCTYVGSQSDEIDLTRNIMEAQFTRISEFAWLEANHIARPRPEIFLPIQTSGRDAGFPPAAPVAVCGAAPWPVAGPAGAASAPLGSSELNESPVPRYHKMESHVVLCVMLLVTSG